MTRRDMYSLKMQDATVVRIITVARKPKMMTDAIIAGVSAKMTSSIKVWVVSFD